MNTQLLHLTTAVRALLLLAALFLALPDLPAQNARPPEKMSYQGYLVDANQLPLGNSSPVNHTVEFRIYSVSSGGTALWGESQTVTVDKGYFSVMLGDGTPIGTPATFSSIFTNATASDRFIGVKVASLSGSTEILPRLRLVPSPYAFLAASAVAVTGTNSIQSYSLSTNIGLWTKTRTNVIYSGGNVGIGSTNPGVPLTFSDTLGDKISLWGQSGNTFGFGIQAGLLQIHGGQSVDDIAFGYGSSAAMTERMRIKGNGNVGIGVVSPTVKLEVAGTVKATAFQGDGSTLTGLAGGLGAGSVDSTKILDGTIVNADISASAAIADTKLGTIASAGKVADSALSGNVALLNNSGVLPISRGGTGSTTQNFVDLVNPQSIGGNKNFTGNVGIGTPDPAQARLVITGTGPTISSTSGPRVGFLNEDGAFVRNLVYSIAPSLYTSGDIRCGGVVYAFSDARIKHIEGHSDAARDLTTIQGIEVTDYSFIDYIGKGAGKQKKVIAQQVEKVFPQAVSKSTDVVPDIYQKATVKDGWVWLATDLKKGERVKLIAEKNEGSIHEVLEVTKDKFRTDFKPEGDQVFVYGREVKDFRSVDYEAISMLNVSATQELARKVKAQEIELSELRAELATLRSEKKSIAATVSALQARDEAREARLVRLEQALDKPAGTAKVQPTTRESSRLDH